MELDGIDHVAIWVSDVERSVAWYREVLGLERRYEVWGNSPAMVGAGTTCLALFGVHAGEPRPPGDGTIGMRHIAFRVDGDGFERAQAELRKRGVEFSFQDHGVSHSIYFRDPDRHELEITTYDLADRRG